MDGGRAAERKAGSQGVLTPEELMSIILNMSRVSTLFVFFAGVDGCADVGGRE